MSDRSGGVGALLVGVALGAAAVFLADEKNRAKVAKTLNEVSNSAVELAKEAKEDPQALAQKVKATAQEFAEVATQSAQEGGEKLSQKTKDATLKALESAEKTLAATKAKLQD